MALKSSLHASAETEPGLLRFKSTRKRRHDLRLDRARRLLSDAATPLSAIAAELGFTRSACEPGGDGRDGPACGGISGAGVSPDQGLSGAMAGDAEIHSTGQRHKPIPESLRPPSKLQPASPTERSSLNGSAEGSA